MEIVTFAGLALLAAPGRVMTPRPASERLVAAAAARLGRRRGVVADVGTGSGAIAIAIARAAPGAVVWATDISRSAVLLARENVRRHGLENRVLVRSGDLLEPVVPAALDVVVANLPYLAASAAAHHPDLSDEPFEAAFAAGDGLDGYRRLVEAAATRLAPDGTLLLQLRRRVVAATRTELAKLQAELSPAAQAASARGSRNRKYAA